MRQLHKIALLALLLTGACNLGKWVPEGEYRLAENEILIDERSAPDNVEAIIKQKPTKYVPNLVYSMGNPADSGFAGWVSGLGKAPTIVNMNLVQRTSDQLGYYYFGKGYFNNTSTFEITRDEEHRRAEILYTVHLGTRYTIRNIEYEVSSPMVDSIVRDMVKGRKIGPGSPYDETMLEADRDRITDMLRNRGFFTFSKDVIEYRADTTVGDHQVDLKMIIGDRVVRTDDSTYTVPHVPWKINQVYVDYDFNYREQNVEYVDTIRYDGYSFLLKQEEEKYSPRLVTRSVHFESHRPYDQARTKETYSHLSSLGVFGASEIEYVPRSDTGAQELDVYVRLTPLPKYSFTTQLEGTNTSGNYGIAGSMTVMNRNTFGGGEIFDVSLKGGLQAQVNTETSDNQLFNTYEVGIEAGLTFSRILNPFKLDVDYPKRMRPSTRFSSSYSQQSRIEFQRHIFKLAMTYRGNFSEQARWEWDVLNFNYVNLIDASPTYLNSLFFKTGFQDNMIFGGRGTFIYEPVETRLSAVQQFLRASLELSGNGVWVGDRAFNYERSEDGTQGLLLNVPYAQYIRFDADYRWSLALGPRSKFIARILGGVTYNYGNSPVLPPFEKNFLAGGSQDIRGWVAYRLGPGALPKYIYEDANYAAVGPVKLIVNMEYRFPIVGSLYGAAFVDAGNVWLFNRDYPVDDFNGFTESIMEDMKLTADDFWQRNAVGTGVGLRYDFGFFQLRFDGGIKVWDPGEPEGYRYVLPGLRWSNVTYNFALGYPF